MRELSQKPDYEMMWKVECELNSQLRIELEEKQKLLDEAIEVIKFYYENTPSSPISELSERNYFVADHVSSLMADIFLSKINKGEG